MTYWPYCLTKWENYFVTEDLKAAVYFLQLASAK